MEEQQMKFYDAFMSAAPADDLFKNFDKLRKDTAESGFSINANFDFIDEQNLETPFQGREFAIKNYPIASSGLSPRAVHNMEMDSPMPAFSKAKFSSHPNVLFNENLSLAEIERLEKNVNTASTIDPKQLSTSPFYRSASPPGLSPTKFSQRSFTDTIQTPKSDFLSPNPAMPRENMSPTYHYNTSPTKRNISPFMSGYSDQQMFNPQRQYSDSNVQPFAPQSQGINGQSQPFTLQPQQYNSMYMKRVANVGGSVTMQQNQNNEYNMGGYEQNMGYGTPMNGNGFDQNEGGFEQNFDEMYDPNYEGPREKKKPIILDESKERYFGRLKFFDENKKYGFIVMDDDGSDIFVHYDDLCKANITKDLLRTARMGNLIRLTFSCMAYIGKYNRSRKAIDIQLLP